ncbi:uncharacterized protein METZ01_LOCUS464504, partial [marine metagenome]
ATRVLIVLLSVSSKDGKAWKVAVK